MSERPVIEERIKELEAKGVDKRRQVLILEDEGYSPRVLIAKYGGIYTAAKRGLRNQKKVVLIIYNDLTYEYTDPKTSKTIEGKINPAALLGMTLLALLP